VKALAALLSGCAVLAVAGCSEDEDEPGRSVTVRPEETIDIGADEYRFDPTRIVVKSAGRNIRLRVVLDNRGSLAHNLHVRDGEREIAGLRSFPPGEKRPLSTNLQPGEYDFVCTVADHEELGMVGRLEVR
jgi:plastocyanin